MLQQMFVIRWIFWKRKFDRKENKWQKILKILFKNLSYRMILTIDENENNLGTILYFTNESTEAHVSWACKCSRSNENSELFGSR